MALADQNINLEPYVMDVIVPCSEYFFVASMIVLSIIGMWVQLCGCLKFSKRVPSERTRHGYYFMMMIFWHAIS